MKRIVLSLGGSLIVPEKIDPAWIEDFKKTLERNYKDYRFIIVCGGGFIAREYISILSFEHKSAKEQSLAGIMATRMNARLMMQFFGKEANHELPFSLKQVKNMTSKNKVVFCGALRYAPNQTSDSTAAKIAKYLKTDFVNLTNIDGLYTDNPKTNKKAKFIPEISWKEFEKRAKEIKYKPGQHFVLDQRAAEIIRKNKIKTYILGKNNHNIDNFLKNKNFRGTSIKS